MSVRVEQLGNYISNEKLNWKYRPNFNSSQVINKIRIYNTVGQLLSEHLFNDSNGEINVNELESGVYFIKINNQVKSYTIIKH